MLTAPKVQTTTDTIQCFQTVLSELDSTVLPSQIPKWIFLRWLTEQGYLLHGSQKPNISEFEPRKPHDLSGDEFSNRTGVFASSDALWAMMYALRGPNVKRMVNMALQLRQETGLSEPYYYLSFASDKRISVADSLLSQGYIYILSAENFEPMPEYEWPGLGQVIEPQWINPNPVKPLFTVPVKPKDFPLPVRLHDASVVDARCLAYPWGFPWLTGSASQ